VPDKLPKQFFVFWASADYVWTMIRPVWPVVVECHMTYVNFAHLFLSFWWAKFTYVGKETRLVTKLFKTTNIKVTFNTNNTIEKILKTKH
jgi:hypothetical protein